MKQDIKDINETIQFVEKVTRQSIDEYLQINSKVFQARLKGKGNKYDEEVIDKGYDN